MSEPTNPTLTYEQIGEPLTGASSYCDEIDDLRNQVEEIAHMIRAGKTIGNWRVKHLDRVVQVLYRVLIFRMEPDGYTFEAGDDLNALAPTTAKENAP